MKGILGLLRHKISPARTDEAMESRLFNTEFADLGADTHHLVPWSTRAIEVEAQASDPVRGSQLLQGLWRKDKYMNQLDNDAIQRMAEFFDFAAMAPNRDIIRQDECGNFMVVLLHGGIAIDRLQPWGERLRLAEASPGEILGEMSLLDNGTRFSSCTTLSDCEIAVLSADALDAMLDAEPTLAANLIVLLARKLSLRLRVVSARLSDKK